MCSTYFHTILQVLQVRLNDMACTRHDKHYHYYCCKRLQARFWEQIPLWQGNKLHCHVTAVISEVERELQRGTAASEVEQTSK